MRKKVVSLLLGISLVMGVCACGNGATPIEEVKEGKNMDYTVVYDLPEGFDRMQDGVDYYKLKEITYDSTTTGKSRKANVLLPADYSEDKEYPVLYLLHGIGGDHKEWLGGAPIQVVTNMVASGEAPEMIVVIPNVRARANDAGNPSDIYTLEHYKAFDNFINDLRDDLMPYIEDNYSIKTGKGNTAIAGLSMGGREALYIGFSMPETFGYIGGFEPAPGLLKYTNFGVAEDGLFTTETFTLPEEANNFVMIVKGKQDGVVGEFPVEYHEALENNEVEHVYYEIDGGHDFTVWKHGLYNFLRAVFK
ncbi:MAG: esterase family protein [Lachnospiraceae bacterium]|nr:esterase family protein [Lachnospiraceae bacterium]